ncbi:MAG: uracil-DNA glycosylase [Turicibacter sp.]|nr:uracil-DNA glycosylase [Turicibacter sp.]
MNLNTEWKTFLQDEFQKPYFQDLTRFLDTQYQNTTVYPPKEEIFTAFNLTSLADVKVVILGQDPYHGPKQAKGLAFSVNDGVRIPPSLRNIYKELVADIGSPQPQGTDLSPWAKQGVLLLNTTLTVEAGKPMSHAKKGWEEFTDHILQLINEKKDPVVFILWGKHAQSKKKLIDSSKHLVIGSVHPSPLSASRGFFGSKPFSKANEFLKANGRQPIDWSLS